jgi:hypothetical protein
MATTLAELRRKVLMGFKNIGGEEIMMAEEAINQACHVIAEVENFDDLLVYDTTNAKTVDGTARYHWVTDWGLTRPKDILSIVLHDDYNSRKLDHSPAQWLDKTMPYPEGVAEGKSEAYTKQGDYITLTRIPDAAYDLYVRYYQWPAVLTEDSDECSFTNIDSTIIALARDLFISYRGGLPLDAVVKAKAYLKPAKDNNRSAPDDLPIAKGFHSQGPIYVGEYWNNPFVKTVK